ncbi:MAG: Pimeloyl-ACP methyl ester carboxylesterase, partial [Mucilaginibacter sp.]|nr:Pimeloyl-ACP methyl ester carboxylesterase [Mucilaginibacter sp.]
MKSKEIIHSAKKIILLILFGLSIGSCKKDSQTATAPALTDYHQTAVTKFVNTGGATYAYRILGDKSGIPLVMLS